MGVGVHCGRSGRQLVALHGISSCQPRQPNSPTVCRTALRRSQARHRRGISTQYILFSYNCISVRMEYTIAVLRIGLSSVLSVPVVVYLSLDRAKRLTIEFWR